MVGIRSPFLLGSNGLCSGAKKTVSFKEGTMWMRFLSFWLTGWHQWVLKRRFSPRSCWVPACALARWGWEVFCGEVVGGWMLWKWCFFVHHPLTKMYVKGERGRVWNIHFYHRVMFFSVFFVAASNWEPHEDQENFSEKHILGDEAIFGDEFIYTLTLQCT